MKNTTKGANTRHNLIETAFTLFALKGYAGTSMSDITQAVGIHKSSLYYFFSSKHSLYVAVIDYAIEEVDNMLDEIGERSWQTQFANNRYFEFLINEPEANRNPDIRALFERIKRQITLKKLTTTLGDLAKKNWELRNQ